MMNCFCLATSTFPGGVAIPLAAVRVVAPPDIVDPDRLDPDCVVVVGSFLSAISIRSSLGASPICIVAVLPGTPKMRAGLHGTLISRGPRAGSSVVGRELASKTSLEGQVSPKLVRKLRLRPRVLSGAKPSLTDLALPILALTKQRLSEQSLTRLAES
jgi:hypothetical protein